jgi:arsenate reductase-like glutaredoxin family protein
MTNALGLHALILEPALEIIFFRHAASMIGRAWITPRELLCEKGTPFAELGLDKLALTDAQLVDAMMDHPVLINRPASIFHAVL